MVPNVDVPHVQRPPRPRTMDRAAHHRTRRPLLPTGLEVSDLTTLFAGLSALTALAVWALVLHPDGHLRDTFTVWALALPLVLWVNPLGRQSRWAVRSLPQALLVWNVVGLTGLLVDLGVRTPLWRIAPVAHHRVDTVPLLAVAVMISVLFAQMALRSHHRHAERLAWERAEPGEDNAEAPMGYPLPMPGEDRAFVVAAGDGRSSVVD